MDKIGPIFSAISLIYKLVEMIKTTKANKERCQRVVERVRVLEELVLTVKQRGPGQVSDIVRRTLEELWLTLISAKDLIMKFSNTNSFKSVVYSQSHAEKFCKVNERLTENLQVLSGALNVENANVLQKIYEFVSANGQNGVEPICPVAVRSSTPTLAPAPLVPNTINSIVPAMPVLPTTTPSAPALSVAPYPMCPYPIYNPTAPAFTAPMPLCFPTAAMPAQCMNPMFLPRTVPLHPPIITPTMSSFIVSQTMVPPAPMLAVPPVTVIKPVQRQQNTSFIKSLFQ